MGCGCKDAKQAKISRGTITFHAKRGQPLKANSRIIEMRRKLCSMCQEFVHDESGKPTTEKLYGGLDGVYYCGNPNDPRTDKGDVRFGCGCGIEERTQWETAKCPRERWGPGKRFGAEVLTFYTVADGSVEQDVYEFIGPAKSALDGTIDCTGIGDTMVQGVAAQSILAQKRDEGLRVRFVTIKSRMAWAELATAGLMPIVDFGDKDRGKALYSAHSAPVKAVEIDATCQLHGMNRQEFIAREHRIPKENVRKWEVNIRPDALAKAQNFLRSPLREQRPIVCISPFTNAPVRQWPMRHWVHLAEILRKEGFAIFTIDRPHDQDKPNRTKFLPGPKFGSNDPHEVAAVISLSSLVIGNDSGMPHVAGFVGTPAVAICGPTVGTVAFGGWTSVEPIQAPGECTGCLWFRDSGWKVWCGYGCEALADLKPRTVFERSVEVMNRAFQEVPA